MFMMVPRETRTQDTGHLTSEFGPMALTSFLGPASFELGMFIACMYCYQMAQFDQDGPTLALLSQYKKRVKKNYGTSNQTASSDLWDGPLKHIPKCR